MVDTRRQFRLAHDHTLCVLRDQRLRLKSQSVVSSICPVCFGLLSNLRLPPPQFPGWQLFWARWRLCHLCTSISCRRNNIYCGYHDVFMTHQSSDVEPISVYTPLRYHHLLSDSPVIQPSATELIWISSVTGTLPQNVTLAPPQSVFMKRLKIHLFSCSFAKSPVVPAKWRLFGHCNRIFYLLAYLFASCVTPVLCY